jgi:hypothetical protein
MEKLIYVEKIIKKYKLNDQAQYDEEIEYWLKVSGEEKLNITQDLREQYIKLFNKQELYDESRKGLRRVYKIIKLSQS